ncbi:MAG: hypothetical protein JSS97_16300 [Actinobacteria bacterium]|nr:hypothetical protein [Actinomycetota bacterium]
MVEESGAARTAGFAGLMRNPGTPTLPFGFGAIGKVGTRIKKLISPRGREVYKRA